MLAEERRRKITELVESRGGATVKELSEEFGVALMTIRRDLEVLAEQGSVIKTHGGAFPPSRYTASEVPYVSKERAHLEEKRRIGRLAASMIKAGETILLDAGSTTLEVARHLTNQDRLTVVTNDLKIALELAHRPDITLVDTGGIVQKTVYTLVGPQTEAFLRGLHVDTAFIGADAVDLEAGITNRTLQEVPVKQAMMQAAERVYLVADSHKFGRRVFAAVAPLTGFHAIVTDSSLPHQIVESLRELGIAIHLA